MTHFEDSFAAQLGTVVMDTSEDALRPRLIGRSVELDVLGNLIVESKNGGHSVVVRGQPGVGKTVLLQEAAAIARKAGSLVVEVSGYESEAMAPFAGLDRLLRPLLDGGPSMPPVQRRALLSAFDMVDDSAPDLFLIALASLTLIAGCASKQPLVLMIDDVQWLDGSTVEVLAFVARRLQDDAVAAIFGLRDGHNSPVQNEETVEIELLGLDNDAAHELIAEVAPHLSASDRSTILKNAQGNPLALVELPKSWHIAEGDVSEDTAAAVPLTSRLEGAFAGRVWDLPLATREALLVAAIDADGGLIEIQDATKLLTGSFATELLEPAEEAGLIAVDHRGLHFRHPLVRSAVISTASLDQRRAAHAALGSTLAKGSYRSIWHLSLSVDGFDDALANDLEDSAVQSVRRGSVITAVASIERAAQLTSDSQRRGRRLLSAAKYAFGLGRAELVERLVGAAEVEKLSELDVARAEWLREAFSEGELGDSDRIFELCRLSERSGGVGEFDLALDLLLSAALRCWWAVTSDEAHDRVVEVAETMPSVGDDPRCIAAISLARPVLGGARTSERLKSASPQTVTDPDRLRILGMAARGLGAEVDAADYFARAESELRKQGRLGLLSHVLAIEAAVLLDLGDWSRAKQCLEDGRVISRDTGQPPWSTGTTVLNGVFYALSGDSSSAMECVEPVESSSSNPPICDFLSLAQLARGIVLLNDDEPDKAFAAFLPMFDPGDPRYHNRQQLSALMFIVEAAVACGRSDDVRPLIAHFEKTVEITPSAILEIHLLYSRAVLAAEDEAETLYRRALEHDLTRWPWPRARIQLSYGNWLRRRRRPMESRDLLRVSLSTFELIGAPTWARQATSALRAAGALETNSIVIPSSVLSAQELQIATLAAQGLSNRQIGEQLYLSPRTVGSHLYRIFPKLGVTSRSQLGARIRTT
jgi:DNA-binding CsgD family transcriptional regulator